MGQKPIANDAKNGIGTLLFEFLLQESRESKTVTNKDLYCYTKLLKIENHFLQLKVLVSHCLSSNEIEQPNHILFSPPSHRVSLPTSRQFCILPTAASVLLHQMAAMV